MAALLTSSKNSTLIYDYRAGITRLSLRSVYDLKSKSGIQDPRAAREEQPQGDNANHNSYKQLEWSLGNLFAICFFA